MVLKILIRGIYISIIVAPFYILYYDSKLVNYYFIKFLFDYNVIKQKLIRYCKKNIINYGNTKLNGIFYYKNNRIVHKTTLLDLLIDKKKYFDNYNFISYEIENENTSKNYRLFNNENEIFKEACDKNKIEFIKPNIHILSAILILKRNNLFEYYDVTPTKKYNFMFQGNYLYSRSFIDYFFNIIPTNDYTVKIIDNNVNEIDLVNTNTESQTLSIKENKFEVITNKNEVYDKHKDESIFDKIKQYIAFYYLKINN